METLVTEKETHMETDAFVAQDPVVETTSKVFGISYLYPWQRLVVANILDAVNAASCYEKCVSESTEEKEALFDEDGIHRGRQIILLPTGTGKSLCFQVPALFLDGPTLVIYPLLALMGDQLRRMQEAGLNPALFRGSQTKEEREAQFARLEGKDGLPPARLIIANPEVLIGTHIKTEEIGANHTISGSEVFKRIARMKPSHIAIDEAHCVSEWGDSFRPAYLSLGPLLKILNPPAITAFTATASPEVLQRISEVLFNGEAHLVRSGSDRPNIMYNVIHCRAKESALLIEVKKRKRPMVIFCSTRGGTEHIAALLRNRFDDNNIKFYHAGLEKEEKLEVESWFHGHPSAILVTTCAWGMGVDKKDVRTVIHKDPSPTAEAYIQEAGRGGRDGSIAEAVLLWSPEDEKNIERNSKLIGKKRAQALSLFSRGNRCRREILLLALGDPYAGSEAPGGEQTACSGCDVCDGRAQNEYTDSDAVLTWLSRNERCRTKEEAQEELYDTANRASLKKYKLLAWSRKDFAIILNGLLKEGKIREKKDFFYKNKLETVKQKTP